MAVSTTLSSDRFPQGATVAAYPQANWPLHQRPPSGAPVGSSAASAAVGADGKVTLAGLTGSTPYFAYALVGGEHRYVAFTAPAEAPGSGSSLPTLTAGDAGKGLLWDGSAWTTPDIATQAELAAAGKGAGSLGQAGMYAVPLGGAVTVGTITMAANRAMAVRFCPAESLLVASISFEVTTAVAGNVDVGIYSAALARLGSSGSTAGKLGATGVANVPLSAAVQLAAGTVYYAAIVTSSAAALRAVSWSANAAAQLFGTAAPAVEMLFKDTALPLPNPIGNDGANPNAPLLALRT